MDYSKTIEQLKAAEQEMLSQIGQNGSESDYETMQSCLNYAQDIRKLYEKIETESDNIGAENSLKAQIGKTHNASKTRSMADPAKTTKTTKTTTESNNKQAKQELVTGKMMNNTNDAFFPMYFVHESRLYKVSQKTKTDALYSKTEPLADVELICNVIISLLAEADQFSFSSLQDRLGNPPAYKAQLTIGALIQTGALKVVGRGKYSPTGTSDVSVARWMDVLRELPDEYDRIATR